MPGIHGIQKRSIDVRRPRRLGCRSPAGRIPGLIACAALLALSACATASSNHCPAGPGVQLQVLGSGGPIADDGRASSSYLVWIDGQSKIIVDVGGGAFLRFGEAGATFNELDFVALSHFHTDHSADLVTLLKTGYFSGRERSLGISGPDAGGPFPSLADYLDSNVGSNGAYAYLSGYLDGSGGLARLDPVSVNHESGGATTVYTDQEDDIRITATGVPHGIVPAIAYRVRVGETDIVFASDQNGNDEGFVDFARGADILVMHMVVPESAAGAMRALHAPPGRIGEIAAASGAGTLVLSHFMARTLEDLEGNVGRVRRHYNGEIVVAEDLSCVNPPDPEKGRGERAGNN